MTSRLVQGAAAAALALSQAAAATYYIDSLTGNDRSPGTSQAAAWKSLDRVNAVAFRPGDRVLFKAGTAYTGHLRPRGSGAPGRPIVVDRYGEGAKPRIDGQGRQSETLLLLNVEYWEVNNLEITNTGPTPEPRRAGARVKAEDFGVLHHIHLKNLV